jgi:RNA polymerase sigma-70 factor, ECF subfamily
VEVFGQVERTVQPQFEQLDDSQRELVAALDRLPRDQREVLVMKIWNELTFAEIGEALGISQNTAASRYRYGLGNLKKTLRPNDQPDAAASASTL